MKKPFKETKLFKFLDSKGLDLALELAGASPGVVGAGAKLLDSIKDSVVSGKLPLEPKDKETALKLIEQEMNELDAMLQDVSNARATEIERLKTGSKNYIQNALAIAGVGFFFSMVGYIIMYGLGEMSAEEAFIVGNLTGGVAGIAYSIFNYYFSSTRGSREKNNTIESFVKLFSKK